MKTSTTTVNPDPKQDMTVPLSLRTVHGGHPPAWTSRQVGRGDWRRPVAAPPGRQFVALARATPNGWRARSPHLDPAFGNVRCAGSALQRIGLLHAR